MDPSGFDNDMFIDFVKKRPCIWDTAFAEYHDKIKKINAQGEVCCEMYRDLKDKTEMERNTLGGELMKKWKSVWDSYFRRVKEKTVPGQAVQNRASVNCRQLEFLATTGIPSPTVSSLDEDAESFLEENVDDPGKEREPVPVSHPDAVPSDAGPSTGPSTLPLPSLPATVHTAKRATNSFNKLPGSKRRLIVKENLIHFMKCPEPATIAVQSTPQGPNDDRSFFESLLPLVKTLPIDAKIRFRVNVMQVLREMGAGMTTASPSTTLNLISHQQQIFPPQEMSQQTKGHLTPLLIHQQDHQQRFPNTRKQQ